MEEAAELGDYLPLSFNSPNEQEYVAFLWDAFETNYTHGRYQFAFSLVSRARFPGSARSSPGRGTRRSGPLTARPDLAESKARGKKTHRGEL